MLLIIYFYFTTIKMSKTWHMPYSVTLYYGASEASVVFRRLTRAGPLLGAERAGPGGVFEHPPV